MTARAAGSLACPCGGRPVGAPYPACCGRYIDHWADAPAPDTEALMRSRYTAFVRGNADHLRASWHPSTRPAQLDLEADLQWLGLQVREHRMLDDTHAEVEFVARSRAPGGRAQRLHERSRFVREALDGSPRWYYVDGELI